MARETNRSRQKATKAEPAIGVNTPHKKDVVWAKSASAPKMSICFHMVNNFNKPKSKEPKEEILFGLLLEIQKTSQDAKQFVDRHHDRISLVLTTIISTIIHCCFMLYFARNP